jgi:hypothetical protein
MNTQPTLRPDGADPASGNGSEPVAEKCTVRMRAEVVGDPVAPADLDYAWEQARCISRCSPARVFCGRTRLSADRHGRSNASVDAIVVLDGERVVCAGAVAATVREAVDQVALRLHTRLTSVPARDNGPSSSR